MGGTDTWRKGLGTAGDAETLRDLEKETTVRAAACRRAVTDRELRETAGWVDGGGEGLGVVGAGTGAGAEAEAGADVTVDDEGLGVVAVCAGTRADVNREEFGTAEAGVDREERGAAVAAGESVGGEELEEPAGCSVIAAESPAASAGTVPDSARARQSSGPDRV